MGYRVFAGPLAMFYAGDYPGAPEQPPFDRQELLDAVRLWQSNVATRIPGVSPWDEGYSKPYLTAELGMDAFGALILRVSCHITGEPFPEALPRGWRFYESEVVDRAMGSDGSVPSFLVTDIWVPSGEIGILRCPGPAGQEISMSTTATLERDLAAMNSAVWGASAQEVSSWSDRPMPEGDPFDAEAMARFAFSALCRMLWAARSNNIPVIVGH